MTVKVIFETETVKTRDRLRVMLAIKSGDYFGGVFSDAKGEWDLDDIIHSLQILKNQLSDTQPPARK